MSERSSRPLDQRTVLVTGRNGAVGQKACAALELDGATVIDNLDESTPAMLDVIVHMAGLPRKDAHPLLAVKRDLALTKSMAHLAHRTGARFVLTSSTDVNGENVDGFPERTSSMRPYPRAAHGARVPFSLDGETAALDDIVRRTTIRMSHADVTSKILKETKDRHVALKAPTVGAAFDDALRVHKAARAAALLDEGLHARLRLFGFLSVRGYANALKEQLVRDELERSTVVRLARIVDENVTSAVMALTRRPHSPADDTAIVDVIPETLAVRALHLATRAAVTGRHEPVVHVTLQKASPLSVARARDVLDLVDGRAQSHRSRARTHATTLSSLSTSSAASTSLASSSPKDTNAVTHRRLQTLLKVARRARRELQSDVIHRVRPPPNPPSTTALDGFIRDASVDVGARALMVLERRLGIGVGAALSVSWPEVFAHTPPLPSRVVVAESAPRFDSILHILTESAKRHPKKVALTMLGDTRDDVTYDALLHRVNATAARLVDAGVHAGDRVLLSGANQPAWPIAFFAITAVGATPIPLDPAILPEQARTIVEKARPRLMVVDNAAEANFAHAIDVPSRDLRLLTTSGAKDRAHALHLPAPDDVASILFTSGTTGEPKGVMLTHANFCSLIASLSTIFDMHGDDRALSLLPLHHTLEFSCGLLLPLAAGAQVFYLDELTPERVLRSLKEGRITGMVGVPALFSALARKMRSEVKGRGGVVDDFFDTAMDAQRKLSQLSGLDVGRVMFKPLRDALGGHLKILISGGAALPKDVHALFQGIGLPIAEGYGLTETAPVLTVATASTNGDGGHVGQPIPGVEIRIVDEDKTGAGEIQARGPNIMKGYFENEAATKAAFTDDGWLRTGDLGRFNDDGALVIVGRAKEVVVSASGENIYLDDVETLVGAIASIAEYTLIGVSDPKGGERLACVYAASDDVTDSASREAVRAAFRNVPVTFRPAVIERVEGPLPRTATRKVKRKDLRPVVEARVKARLDDKTDEAPPVLPVRQAIAALVGKDVGELRGAMSLEEDLGFDSLLFVELASLLAPLVGTGDPEALYDASTIAGVELLVGRPATPKPRVETKVDDDDDRHIHIPSVVRTPLRAALTTAQRDLFQTIFKTDVTGRSHIPWNEPVIVVANHTSHLDTGLVKFALGRYGKNLRPLAAKDYFFEGNPLKVAFFENFTNLVALDRESVAGRAFDQALDVVKQGHTVLIYPEGTRRTDGTLGAFKPLVGRLAMTANIPVLPVFLDGAFDALPKGSRFPRARNLRAVIGAPIRPDEIRAALVGDNPVDHARQATRVIHTALSNLMHVPPIDDDTDRMPPVSANIAGRPTTS